MSIDRRLRSTFDEVAELYDQFRPGYPEELFEEIAALSGIPAGGRILEVGCGPGTATVAFARQGYRVLCLELGPRLAALAAHNCRACPQVEVRNLSFEEWEVEEGAFDLVFSAEAFHWIPPEIAYPKAARALKASGALALCWILYLDHDSELCRAIDEVYRERAPQIENPSRALTPGWLIGQIGGNLERSGSYGEVTVRQYAASRVYRPEEYVGLLRTFSAHRELDGPTQQGLFEGIGEAIERFGGRMVRPYQVLLFVAPLKR